MTIKLTDKQKLVLLAFPGGVSAEGDNGASWTEVADLAKETGLTKSQVAGVLSGLSQKGLVYTDEERANGEAGAPLQCLTDEGARLVGTLADTPEDAARVIVSGATPDGMEVSHTTGELQAEIAADAMGSAEVAADAAEMVADAVANIGKGKTTKAKAKTKATTTPALDPKLADDLDKAFAAPAAQAVREEHGVCRYIRELAKAHPEVPVSDFLAAAVRAGIHRATASIQRNKALAGK